MLDRLKVIGLGFAAGVVGGVVVAVVNRAHPHVEFGDLATWATALVALPAVVFGVDAFRQQRADVERLQQRQDAQDALLQRQLDREERATALLVDVEVTPVVVQGAESKVRRLNVTVVNGSDRPVYNVDCRFLFEHSVRGAEEATELFFSQASWGERRVAGKTLPMPVPVVGPGKAVRFTHQIETDYSQDEIAVQVRFSDDFLHWSRFRDGLLFKLATRDW